MTVCRGGGGGLTVCRGGGEGSVCSSAKNNAVKLIKLSTSLFTVLVEHLLFHQ